MRTLTMSIFALSFIAGCDGQPDPLLDSSGAYDLKVAPTPAQIRCVVDGDDDGTFDAFIDLWNASLSTMTIDECAALRGVVIDEPPPRSDHRSSAEPPVVPLPMGPTPQVVLDYIDSTGIPGEKYVPKTHDCDDFADEAEQAIEDVLPGGGTFTMYICNRIDGEGNFDSSSTPHEFHAVTDVHAGGPVSWLEPDGQHNGGKSRNWDLDLDNDGMVNAGTGWGSASRPTEVDPSGEWGCYSAVYPDRAAAEADDGPLD